MISDFDKFYMHACELQIQFSRWRWGQCLFNALLELHPDLAEEIRGSEHGLDPYYFNCWESSKINPFLLWAREKLDGYV
jgi:hypothetical protein